MRRSSLAAINVGGTDHVLANYAHPLETLTLGFGTILPILLFGLHLFTLYVWLIARQTQAISVHSGYDFPWSFSHWLPLCHGARFHDRHHTKFNYNFAPTFSYLDQWFGTEARA